MPTAINGYEVLPALGSGAIGKTYRVRKRGKICAMKVLKPEAIRDEVDLKRFRRECRALQKITSEHVVAYHDQGVFDDEGVPTYYIVMDFVEGMDLQRKIRTAVPPLPEADIRGVASQVLAGLADIHAERIVHRDLKPANIFVTRDGVVKIFDFALVKMLDYTTLTMTGVAAGTPLYMSPEVILGREIDLRSDLYAFGVLLFHLLTGKFPFTGDNHMQLMHRVTQEPPARPTSFNVEVSNGLENLVLRLLEKEPFLRPGSAEEVAELLERTPFFKVEETPVLPREEAWGLGRRMCFIRMLHNEKSAVEKFLSEHSIEGVVFQANYIPRYERHLEVLRARGVPYLFDPSTNWLAYSKFSETEGLKNLIKVEMRASLGAAGKVEMGNTSVSVEGSLGAKVQLGPVKLGLQGSMEETTVQNGKAIQNPQTKTEGVVGLDTGKASVENIGEIEVEATLGLAKFAISFNPIALVDTVIKAAIAVREGMQNLKTEPVRP